MQQRDDLTNEALKGICDSNFELTFYAIALGRHRIRSGHETTVQKIIEEVKKHPNPQYMKQLEKAAELMEKERESEE